MFFFYRDFFCGTLVGRRFGQFLGGSAEGVWKI